jgi:pimeloyl-ACP methyl ester carboxylesterase
LKSATAFAEGCYESRQDTGRFIGTPFVARDMISIVDALDQGPKLNFWGTSYGTVLGQVTASIFPERIGRMLIDANLKADDYATTTWISSMRDTERALAHLLDECVEAGTDLCSLADYHGENTTGKSLLTALDELLKSYVNGGSKFKSNASKSELNFAVVEFKRSIFTDLYDPARYPAIVSRIEGFLTGNETAMIPGEGTKLTTPWNIAGDLINLGISCSDSSLRVEDPDDLFSIYQAHLAEGSFSETSVAGRLICAQWKFSAAEQIDTNKLRNVKTSFPILVVNSKYDPVTSLSGAWEVSARFRGSRVVIHEGVGVSIALTGSP